jgi:phosphopantothenoylcysteine decarboxylase/phosphopantothenate--cysteine ligase
MGYALAAAAIEQGASVILISGPVSIAAPPEAAVMNVQTAEDMYRETHEHVDAADIFIAAAAVSDYRPVEAQTRKMKKDAAEISIDLIR